jgi:hypothetical protein
LLFHLVLGCPGSERWNAARRDEEAAAFKEGRMATVYCSLRAEKSAETSDLTAVSNNLGQFVQCGQEQHLAQPTSPREWRCFDGIPQAHIYVV